MTPALFRQFLHDLLSHAAYQQDIRGHDVRIEALEVIGADRIEVAFSDDTTKTITITDGGTS